MGVCKILISYRTKTKFWGRNRLIIWWQLLYENKGQSRKHRGIDYGLYDIIYIMYFVSYKLYLILLANSKLLYFKDICGLLLQSAAVPYPWMLRYWLVDLWLNWIYSACSLHYHTHWLDKLSFFQLLAITILEMNGILKKKVLYIPRVNSRCFLLARLRLYSVIF